MTPFRTILVAADFSERSEEAFRVACSLAGETKSRVFVLHVLEQTSVAEQPVGFDETGRPSPLGSGGFEHAEGRGERLRERYVPDRPVDIEYQIREGAPAEELLRAAREIGADLIVLGTHGRTGLRRLLTGSVAESVLRHAPCPVLALHTGEDSPAEARPIRVILHPTDFSERSRAAARVARALALDHGARLMLLHVEPIKLFQGVALAPPLDPRTYYEPLVAMRDELDGPDLKAPVEMKYRRGDPVTEILHEAEEIRCDLIVLGTHGRTGLTRLLMGSVAEAVLRRTGCPSLIIKFG